MKGVQHIYGDLKVGESKTIGLATISKFELSQKEAARQNMRYLCLGQEGMQVHSGTFIRLVYDGTLEMSDTRMEKNTNTEFIQNAHGDVFIAGLGIGMVLENLRDKLNSGEITSITILELRQDIIDLVSPYFADMKNLTIIQGDIMEYLPAKTDRYDTIYFDIWPTISSDNLDDIKILHNRWKFKKPKTGWMNSWVKEWCQKLRREERSSSWGWGF